MTSPTQITGEQYSQLEEKIVEAVPEIRKFVCGCCEAEFFTKPGRCETCECAVDQTDRPLSEQSPELWLFLFNLLCQDSH